MHSTRTDNVLKKRGFVAYLLIALTGIIYVVFYGYHSVVMNSMDRAHYTMTLQSVRNVAFSVVNAIFPYLSYKCRTEPTSPLARFINDESQSSFDIDPAADPLLRNLFNEFKPNVVEKITLRSVTRETEAGDAAQDGMFRDPYEKKVIVEIACIVLTGKIRYECRIRRRITRLLSTVPLYSKFTLMVRNRSSQKLIYNLFANTIAGAPDAKNQYLPVTLFNHNASEDPQSGEFTMARKAYALRGYAYFGSETVLNKTAGFHKSHGEMFHFVKAGDELGFTRCYSNLGGNLPFVQPNPPGGYLVEYTPLGYYIDMFADPSSPNILKRYTGLPPFSSVLHLYGNQQAPSPTLVLGKVYQSYPVYKCLTNDLNQNGKVESNPELEYVMVNALGNRTNFFHSPELTNIPTNFRQRSADAHGSWLAFCDSSYPNYAKLMSLVVREPYNRAYNYMNYAGFMSQEIQPSVMNQITDAETDDLMNNLANFKLSAKNSDGTETQLFSGDPGAADITKILRTRVQKRYKNQDEFFRECLRQKTLTIAQCVVEIEKGPVVFPENVEVAEGGVVLLSEGGFELRGVSAQKTQILSLYAAAGGIKLDAAFKYRYVSLNAPEGSVKNSSPNYALDLVGNVACKIFDHTSFPQGGKIQYSHYLDPANPKFAAARYKLIFNPSILTLEFNRK